MPLFFRPDSKKALVIGLASGITAGLVTLHSGTSSIDIIELEPSVVDASHEFDNYNNRPLDDPRVDLYINDARNHLPLAEDHTYDVVISEPSNPWLSGVSNLFTWEFFQLGKQKLRKGGVWSQWVHAYAMTTDDMNSLLATFADTYAYVLVFRVDTMDLVLLGSDKPLLLDASINNEMLEGVAEIPLQAVNGKDGALALAESYAYRDVSWRRVLDIMKVVVNENPDDHIVRDLYNTYKELAEADEGQ